MASATAAISSMVKSGVVNGRGVPTPMKASASGYKGCMGIFTSGYCLDASDAASSVFAGVFAEDVTGGATDGVVFGKLLKTGIFAFGAPNGAATDLGKECTISSNQEVDLAAATTNDVACGKIVGWQVNGVNWVKFATGAKALVKINGYC